MTPDEKPKKRKQILKIFRELVRSWEKKLSDFSKYNTVVFFVGWIGLSLSIFIWPLIKKSTFDSSHSGLTGFYFSNPELTGSPSWIQVDSSLDFDWSNGTPIFGFQPFGIRWKGFLDIPRDDIYSFGLISDDDSRLSIGNNQIIDYKPGDLLILRESHPIFLKKGPVPIEVILINRLLGSSIKLFWSEGSGSLEIIASQFLHPLPPQQT